MDKQVLEEKPTTFGSFNPVGTVLVVADDIAAAAMISEELATAGFESRAWAPAEVIEGLEAIQNDRNAAQKLGAFLSDEELWSNQYLEFARQGNAFVTATAPKEEDGERAREVIEGRPIRLMRHYGDSVATDLLPRP